MGSSDDDTLSSAIVTSDGGYLLVGSSLIKIDREGNQQWEKPIRASSITRNADGDYLLGANNFMIIKIDEEGHIQWEKTFGGNAADRLTDVITTPDGGYLLAGYSSSDASGDKSEDSKWALIIGSLK